MGGLRSGAGCRAGSTAGECLRRGGAHADRGRAAPAGWLRALGLHVIEVRANYLLFRAPADFDEKLRQHGAVVRSCGNYPSLDDGWCRTTVSTAKESTKLLAIMKEVLA